MSSRGEIFLGIIAFATLATALVQIGVLVAAGLLARRLTKLTERVEEQMKPIFAHLDSIGRDASRASALATAQVERVDGLVAELIARLEQAMDAVQAAVRTPVREVAAVRAGLAAMLGSLRTGRRPRSRSRGDDEDALFI